MPDFDAEVWRVVRDYRAALESHDAEATRLLTERYLQVEDALEDKIVSLSEQVKELADKGETSVWRIYELERYQRLQAQLVAELAKYNADAARIIASAQGIAIDDAATSAAAMLTAGAPEGYYSALDLTLNMTDWQQLGAMIGNTADGTPLARLMDEVNAKTRAAVDKALTKSTALGRNPKVTAAEIRRACRMPLQRALLISRTEQLRVARETSSFIYQKAGVTQYERVCSYDDRTCIACIAADGDIYDANIILDDHPNGRCTTIPIIPDPNDPNANIPFQRQSATDWFRKQDVFTQQQMMGPTRWSLWKQNYANFKELATHTTDPVWGGSVKLTPIRELMAEATGKLDGTKAWASDPDHMGLKLSDYHHLVDDDGNPIPGSLDRWVDADGNLDPVRAARHERIVERFCSDRLPSQEHPLAQRIGGASASGKSTMKGNGQIEVMGDDIAAQIDADEVKKMLPEYENMLAGTDEEIEKAAAFVHEESSYLAKLIEARALERKVNYVTDGVNDGGLGKCINQIKLAQKLGYRVEGFFATVPTSKALEWAKKRAARTKRKVPEKYIKGAHENVSEIFPELAPYFDECVLFDNWSDGKGVSTLVARAVRGEPVEVVDEALWRAFLTKSAVFQELERTSMDTRLSRYGAAEVKALRKALAKGDDTQVEKALDDLRASYTAPADELTPEAALALRHEEYERQLDEILDKMIADGELPPPGTGFGEAPSLLDPRNFADGQLTPERREEYKAILRKMVPEKLEPQEVKRAQMLGGGTASGKSTTVDSGLVDIMGDDVAAIINADDAKEMLHDYSEFVARGEYKGAANHVHEESSFLYKAAQRLAMRRRLNFVIDGTNDGGAASAIKKVDLLKNPKAMADQVGCSVDDIGEAYRIEGVFCTLSQKQAFANAEHRAAGASHRWVNPRVSEGNHAAVSNIFEECAPHYDDIALYDNEIRGKPRLVARLRPDGTIEVVDEELWTAFLQKSALADGRRRVAAGEAEDVVQRQLNDEDALWGRIKADPFEMSAGELEKVIDGYGLDAAARQRLLNHHYAAREAERMEREVALLRQLEGQTDPYGMSLEDFDALLASDDELRELERFGIKVERTGPRDRAQHNYRTHTLNPRDRVFYHHEIGHAWQDVFYRSDVPEASDLINHVKATADLYPAADPGSVQEWEAFAHAYDRLAKGGKWKLNFDDAKFGETVFPSEAALNEHLMKRLQTVLGLNDEQMEAYVAKQAKRLKVKPKEVRFWQVEDRVGEFPRALLPTAKDIARKRLEVAQMRFDELFARARLAVADELPKLRPLRQMTPTQATKWLSKEKLTGYASGVWGGDDMAATACAAFKADAARINAALRKGSPKELDRAWAEAGERALPGRAPVGGAPDERVIEQFHEAFDEKVEKFGLTPHTDEELRGAVVGVSETGATYAVLPDGDIVSVTRGLKGEGSHAVVRAIEDGGTHLDCFDGKLKSYYEDFGFVEKGRMKWDDAYAPPGWDYEKMGRPDIVLMELDRSRYARYLERHRDELPAGLWRDDFARSVGADAARSGRAAGASEAATAELRGAFDRAIGASPATTSEVRVFRYVDDLEQVTGGAVKVGDTFVERGYLSTSLNISDVPRERSILDITVPEGEHALAADVFSEKREFELVFGHGRELRVTGERYVDEAGRLHLPVELVPQKPPTVAYDVGGLTAKGPVAELKGAAKAAQDTGTLDSFATIHSAALGFDDAASVADSLGGRYADGISEATVKRASREVTKASQEALVRDGFPEEFVVYRVGDVSKPGVVRVSTRPWRPGSGVKVEDARAYVVRRDDILTYGEGVQRGTFAEDELQVVADKLRLVDESVEVKVIEAAPAEPPRWVVPDAPVAISRPEGAGFITVEMDVDQYLAFSHEARFGGAEGGVSRKTIDELKERMATGKELDPAVLDFNVDTAAVLVQDGEHRAVAASELGIKRIPVRIYLRDEASSRFPGTGITGYMSRSKSRETFDEWETMLKGDSPVAAVTARRADTVATAAPAPTAAPSPFPAVDVPRETVAEVSMFGVPDELSEAEAKWVASLSDDEAEALKAYTKEGGHPTPEQLELAARAAERAPVVDDLVYRGISTPYKSAEMTLDDWRGRVGEVIEWKGLSSTSLNPALAVQHAKGGTTRGIIFEVRSRRGRYISDASVNDDEAEVLLNNARLRVSGVEKVQFENEYEELTEHWVVQLEEVVDEVPTAAVKATTYETPDELLTMTWDEFAANPPAGYRPGRFAGAPAERGGAAGARETVLREEFFRQDAATRADWLAHEHGHDIYFQLSDEEAALIDKTDAFAAYARDGAGWGAKSAELASARAEASADIYARVAKHSPRELHPLSDPPKLTGSEGRAELAVAARAREMGLPLADGWDEVLPPLTKATKVGAAAPESLSPAYTLKELGVVVPESVDATVVKQLEDVMAGRAFRSMPREKTIVDMSDAETKAFIKRTSEPGYDTRSHPDEFLGALLDERGARGLPTVVDELPHGADRAPGTYFRGIGDPKYADEFREGEFYVTGGMLGSGSYFAVGGRQMAEGYAGEFGEVIEMALRADARVASLTDIEAITRPLTKAAQENVDRIRAELLAKGIDAEDPRYWEAIQEADAALRFLQNPGQVAAALGYDAIDGIVGAGDRVLLLLNRSKTFVVKSPGREALEHARLLKKAEAELKEATRDFHTAMRYHRDNVALFAKREKAWVAAERRVAELHGETFVVPDERGLMEMELAELERRLKKATAASREAHYKWETARVAELKAKLSGVKEVKTVKAVKPAELSAMTEKDIVKQTLDELEPSADYRSYLREVFEMEPERQARFVDALRPAQRKVWDELQARLKVAREGKPGSRLRELDIELPDKTMAGMVDELLADGTLAALPMRTGPKAAKAAVLKAGKKYSSGGEGDKFLAELQKRRGFDAKPEVVDRLDADDVREFDLYRGVSSREQAEAFIDGELFPSTGMWGDGSYFTYHPKDALDTAASYGDHVIHAALAPDAVIMDYDQIATIAKRAKLTVNEAIIAAKKAGATKEQLDELMRIEYMVRDPGRVAALLGVDAINVPRGPSFMVVLNRGKLKVERQVIDAKAGELPPVKLAEKLAAPAPVVGAATKPPTIKELGIRPSKALTKEDIDKVDAFMASDDYAAFEVKKTLSDMAEEDKGAFIAAGGSKHEGDRLLPAILKATGGDAKPELVDFGALPAGKAVTAGVDDVRGARIYRGVTSPKYADDFREGDFFASTGLHGSGSYFSVREALADEYVGTTGGEVISAVIKPTARIIDERELSKTVSKLRGSVDQRIFETLEELKAKGIGVDDPRYWEAMEPLRRAEYLLRDQGKVAALLGYDGVYIASKGYVTIVNRGALIVERRAAGKTVLKTLPGKKTPPELREGVLVAKAKGPLHGTREEFEAALAKEPLLDDAAKTRVMQAWDDANGPSPAYALPEMVALREAIASGKKGADVREAYMTAMATKADRPAREEFVAKLSREPLLDETARERILLEYDIAASGKPRLTFLIERESAKQEAKFTELIESVTGYDTPAFESMLKGADATMLTDAAKERLRALNRARERERKVRIMLRDDEGRMSLADLTGILHRETDLPKEAKDRLRTEYLSLHKVAKREQTMRELYIPKADTMTRAEFAALVTEDPVLTPTARGRLLSEFDDAKTAAALKAKEAEEAAKYEARWLETLEEDEGGILALSDDVIRDTLESIASLTPEARVRLLARAKELKTGRFEKALSLKAHRLEKAGEQMLDRALRMRLTEEEFWASLPSHPVWSAAVEAGEDVAPLRQRLIAEFVKRTRERDALNVAASTKSARVDEALRKQLLKALRGEQADTIRRELKYAVPDERKLVKLGLLPKNYDSLPTSQQLDLLDEAKAKFVDQRIASALDSVTKATDGVPITVRVKGSDAKALVDDGRFKTQFETHTSNGYLDSGNTARAHNEQEGFGYSPYLDPTLRPVYGYVDVGDNFYGASQYGDMSFQFGDSVRSRTTISWIDSLGSMGDGILRPAPLVEPDVGMFHRGTAVEEAARGADAVVDHFKGWGSYLEAQIHGGLPLSEATGLTYHFVDNQLDFFYGIVMEGPLRAGAPASVIGYDAAMKYAVEHGLDIRFDIVVGGSDLTPADLERMAKELGEHYKADPARIHFRIVETQQ